MGRYFHERGARGPGAGEFQWLVWLAADWKVGAPSSRDCEALHLSNCCMKRLARIEPETRF